MTRPVIILIEGPDGVGKTTLARELIKNFESAGHHPVFIHNDATDATLPGSLYRRYLAQLLDARDRAAQGVSTIIDRTFLSELIYGELYRGAPRITRRQAKRLERVARSLGADMLAVWAPLEDRRRRILDRGEAWTALDAIVGAEYSVWFRARARYWRIVERRSA